jgi:hypothetical protein
MELNIQTLPGLAESIREEFGSVDYMGKRFVSVSNESGEHAQVIKVVLNTTDNVIYGVQLVGLEQYHGETAWTDAQRAASDYDLALSSLVN